MARKKKNQVSTADTSTSDIANMVLDRYNSSEMVDWRTQMENDFDLLTLKEYEAEADHQSYTSPKPRNHFMKVLQGLNKASLTWNIAIAEDAPEDERKAANKGEDLLTAFYTKVDRDLRRRGEPSLREGLSFLGCSRGGLGARCLIYQDEDGQNVIDVRSFDPMHAAWETGIEGLVWGAQIYIVTKYEAKQRWGIDLGTGYDTAKVIDFFNTKDNTVLLYEGTLKEGRTSVIKEPTSHGLDHVPFYIGFASSMPTIYTEADQPTVKHRAASVFASSRGIYEPFNKQVSFVMDTMEKSIAGTLGYWTAEGTKPLKANPFANWQVVGLKIGEELKPIEPPKVPPESAVIMSIIDRDLQESSVPYPTGYGIDPASHSGAALAMLNDNMRSLYDPYCTLLSDAYRWLSEEMLTQFKNKGKKFTFNGVKGEGKFFKVEAVPSDIKDDWYITVKVEPKLPRDEAGELQMALAATNPRPPDGRPLLSWDTAMEKIVKLQNPDAEKTRIDDQILERKIQSLPQIQVREIAMALLKKGDRKGAEEFLASLPPPPPMTPPTPPGAPPAIPGAGNGPPMPGAQMPVAPMMGP